MKAIKKKKIELLMEIEEKNAKIEEYLNLAKRIKADFENYKKQQEKEKNEFEKLYKASVILEFLPVFDNLERALNQIPSLKCQESNDLEKFIEGIVLVKKQFEEILKKLNIQRIKTLDCKFDPKFHIAISAIPSKDKEGLIIEEIQSGWELEGFCLRPAQVIVGGRICEEEVLQTEG